MTAREEELIAREMLEKPELLARRLKERRWADVAALVSFAQRDVPPALAMTIPLSTVACARALLSFTFAGVGPWTWINSTPSPMQNADLDRA